LKSAHVLSPLDQVPSATSVSISAEEEEYLPYYCYLRDATVVTRWYSRLFMAVLADIHSTALLICMVVWWSCHLHSWDSTTLQLSLLIFMAFV
jgi:hypothetical protein